MNIAILLKTIRGDKLDDQIHVVLLTIENNKVNRVTNEYIEKQTIYQITFWLLLHHIDIVCLQDTDEITRKYYSRIGIEIKTFDETKGDPILKSFFF